MRHLALAPLIATVLLLPAACDNNCHVDQNPSVVVRVTDSDGAAIGPVSGVYTVDGGEPGDCAATADDTLSCGRRVGAYEVVVSVPGYDSQTVQVDVGNEGESCWIATEVVDLQLQPAHCPPSQIYGAQLTVVDESGTPITEATVTVGRPNADAMPQPCDHAGDNVWLCGPAMGGDLELSVTDAGPYQPWLQVVTVPDGECGPETAMVDVELEFLPD